MSRESEYVGKVFEYSKPINLISQDIIYSSPILQSEKKESLENVFAMFGDRKREVYLLISSIRKENGEPLVDMMNFDQLLEIIYLILKFKDFEDVLDELREIGKYDDPDIPFDFPYIFKLGYHQRFNEMIELEFLEIKGRPRKGPPCKCGATTVTEKIIVTRSLDEPTTVETQCVGCGRRD